MRGDQFFTELSKRPPFTKLHPRVAAFFKDYFAHEKVISFAGQSVVNTNFPPYPSPAFNQLVEHFTQLGNAATRRLYSVTLAVTNRCSFNCWHCYNAGRSQTDLPLAVLKDLAAELQNLGSVMVTLTGGEPLLRDDLEDIVQAFDDRSCLILGTTSDGLTPERAARLKAAGLFAVGISLDSQVAAEHDRLRGRPGAFQVALQGLRIARESGLYPYVVSVATREFLPRDRFLPFLRFAAEAGALEVHLLEPCPTGKLAGQKQVLLSGAERQHLIDYQHEAANDASLPIVSSLAYLEADNAFGCGAGLTHLYIDGSGEVCPCNLMPLSFGNLTQEPLRVILNRMGECFRRPRTHCVGRTLSKHYPQIDLPAPREVSAALCQKHLPQEHPVPAFFLIRDQAQESVGARELQAAYNRVHGDYDEFWLTEAAQPIHHLVECLPWTGKERVFEAGCGTGYATALLAARAASVLAVDLSEAMLSEARKRLQSLPRAPVHFVNGDALAVLPNESPFELIFSSWVLGYIPLEPFFKATTAALSQEGRLAFIVHRENSPREPLEIFAELVAENPAVLQKRVAFDFPANSDQAQKLMTAAGMRVEQIWEDGIVFRYPRAEQVLEHLLKSGAGTAFYDAIDPRHREDLTQRFLHLLNQRQRSTPHFEVCHEYIACVARKQ